MRNIILGALSVIAADQLSKSLIVRFFSPGESVPVLAGCLHLTYVQNWGAAFGVLKGRTSLLVGLTVVVVVALLMYVARSGPLIPLVRVSLALMLGGAVGNLLDRVRLGYVIDFLDIRIWPVFNVADMALVAGTGLLMFYILKMEMTP